MNENLEIWSEELHLNYKYINLAFLMINNISNWVFEYKIVILQILKYILQDIFNMILKVYIQVFFQNIWWSIISSENLNIW